MAIRKIEKELVSRVRLGILPFYSLSEITKMVGQSRSNVCREVNRMVDVGILIKNNIIPTKPTYQLSRKYYLKYYNGNIDNSVKTKNNIGICTHNSMQRKSNNTQNFYGEDRNNAPK